MIHPHRTRRIRLIKRVGKRFEKSVHRIRRIRIHHQPFTPGACTFDELSRQNRFDIRRFSVKPPLQLPTPVRRVDLRSAKAPPAARCKIHAKPVLRPYAYGIGKRLHPIIGKIPAVFAFIPLRTVDRYHMKTAKTLFLKGGTLRLKAILINGASHPPVIDPWF